MTTIGADPAVGVQAPDPEVTDGRFRVRFSSLWRERPLVLVFLRSVEGHNASDHAVQLRDALDDFTKAGGQLAAVAAGTPEEVKAFREHWNLGYTIYCDEAQDIFREFRLSIETVGTFVIDTGGVIRFAHRSHGALDNPTTWTLVDTLSELTGQTVERPEALPEPSETDVPEVPKPGVGATLNFTCAKCGHNECEVNDMSATSEMLSQMVNLQNRRFSAVSCRRCTYTELYKTDSGALRNVFDLLVGS